MRTSKIKITNAPASLKEQIKDACRNTYEEHRARQPYAFPENVFDLGLEPGIDKAFKTEKGRPLSESPIIFAAYICDDFAGYVILTDGARPKGPDIPLVNISDIYVVPEHRGKNVGTALLEHIKSLSKQRDWDNLSATIWHGNESSERLFREAGFMPQNSTLRFGPDRQARDIPYLNIAKIWRTSFFLFLAVLLFMIAVAFLVAQT